MFKEHEGAITCMITDQPGKILFTGSTDQSIRSWNIKRGERLKVFDGHQASIICLLVVNKMLFTGSSDHTAKAWVTEFGDCTRTFRGHKHTVSSLKCHDGICKYFISRNFFLYSLKSANQFYHSISVHFLR